MKQGKIYLYNQYVGLLTEDETGFTFAYDADYLASSQAEAVSLTLPFRDISLPSCISCTHPPKLSGKKPCPFHRTERDLSCVELETFRQLRLLFHGTTGYHCPCRTDFFSFDAQ